MGVDGDDGVHPYETETDEAIVEAEEVHDDEGEVGAGGGTSAHSPTDTTCVIPRAWSIYAFEA